MTEIEIKDFREKFRRIVFLKSEIKTINSRIMAYTQKDKDGNFQQAILRAIEKKQTIKSEFDTLLKGIPYEQWLEFSKKLSNVQNSQRASRTESNRAFWDKKVEELKFIEYAE